VISNAKRTWAIDVGVSSRVDNELEIVQYMAEDIVVFAEANATDPCPSNPNAHPVMPGLLYIDVFGDPSCNPCVGNMFVEQYGNITAEFLYRNPAPMSQSGDTLLAVYDFTANTVYIAFSQNGTPAYSRSMMELNMTQLFALQPNMTTLEERL